MIKNYIKIAIRHLFRNKILTVIHLFGLGIFLASGMIALVIALLTVSFQSIKAATANPVDSLRYE